jgi:hypothetical protein
MPAMTETYPPDMSDEDLDRVARREAASASLGVVALLEEKNRRSVDRQTRQSIALTDEIRRLTSQIRWLTFGAIALAVISLTVAIIALVRT